MKKMENKNYLLSDQEATIIDEIRQGGEHTAFHIHKNNDSSFRLVVEQSKIIKAKKDLTRSRTVMV